MKLDAYKGDTGYLVFIDGVEQQYVVRCDTEEGWAEVYTGVDRSPFHGTEVRKGVVTVKKVESEG